MSSGSAVFVCDAAGVVREVVLEAPFMDLHRALGRPLVAVLDHGSADKAFAMLDELRTIGSVAGWELSSRVADQLRTIRVSGVVRDGRSLLIATASGHDTLDIVHELMSMNNEHTTVLRSALREAVERERDSGALDRLTVLNNEMAGIQRELARKNAELARLNAQKDAILGIVAHDLRNPLGVVFGFAKLMLRDPTVLSAGHVKFLESILGSIEFMLEMVTDLLDISAIEAGKLALDRQPLELVALVERAVANNQMVADDKDITISLARGGGPIWIEGDAGRLAQMMNNLLSNAIKYSDPGTGVEVAFERDGSRVTVVVRDHGQGIPAAELDDLFEAFRTTSVRPTAGERSTGLGLAIVKRIVEAHEGRIRVESQVGVGTSFRVQIPCCEAPPT